MHLQLGNYNLGLLLMIRGNKLLPCKHSRTLGKTLFERLMFAIAPYIFYVVDDKDTRQDLSSINGVKFLEILKQYFSGIINRQIIMPQTAGAVGVGKTFVFQKSYKGSSGSFAGLYKTGEYGFETEIYSFSRKKVSHQRKVDEADMMPFNFCFYMAQSKIKADRFNGLLLLSRFNNYGIKDIVSPDLIDFFAKANPGLNLKIERYVPEKLVSKFVQSAHVTKIRLIRRGLPADLAGVLSQKDQAKVQSLECIIRPQRKTWFSDIDWALNQLDKTTKFDPKATFTLGEFTPDRVKLEMVSNGLKRTFDMGNLGKISSNILLENVTVGRDGYVANKDWLREFDKLADEIFQSWSVSVPKWKTEV